MGRPSIKLMVGYHMVKEKKTREISMSLILPPNPQEKKLNIIKKEGDIFSIARRGGKIYRELSERIS